jgi:putative nucleotidyltransferase with HDIG domain
LISEGIYSWQLVFGVVAGLGLGLADLTNVLALIATVIVLALIAGITHWGRRRVVLSVSNILVVMVFVFSLQYTAILRPVASQLDVGSLLVLSGYTLMSVLTLAIVALLWQELPAFNATPAIRQVIVAVAVYSLGLFLWPLWRLSSLGLITLASAEFVASALFLGGYLLLFIAAARRMEDPSGVWLGVTGRPRAQPAPWLDMCFSVLAAVTVVGAGIGAYRAVVGSADETVYLLALFASALVMVGRTTLFAFYDVRITSRLVTDRTTGALNPRGLEAQVAEHVASAARFGEGFVLALAELEGFAQPGTHCQSASVDRTLSRAVDVLADAFESPDRIFRLTRNRLAVLVPLEGGDGGARDVALRVRECVRTVNAEGFPVDCSVGFVQCPQDAIGYEALIGKAETALSWTTLHGSGHVVGHSDIAARASVVEIPLNRTTNGSHIYMVRALSAAADARDPAYFLHSRNVAAMVRLLAESREFDADTLELIQIAGLLHDVGKIALPRDVPTGRAGGRATCTRQQEHCTLGAQMLVPLGLPGVASWVRHHHERWDGTGYPAGLKGDQIPVEARMIALANHYDLRISGAHYRAPMSGIAALQEIDLGIGTHFDPVLAGEFIEMLSAAENLAGFGRWAAS